MNALTYAANAVLDSTRVGLTYLAKGPQAAYNLATFAHDKISFFNETMEFYKKIPESMKATLTNSPCASHKLFDGLMVDITRNIKTAESTIISCIRTNSITELPTVYTKVGQVSSATLITCNDVACHFDAMSDIVLETNCSPAEYEASLTNILASYGETAAKRTFLVLAQGDDIIRTHLYAFDQSLKVLDVNNTPELVQSALMGLTAAVATAFYINKVASNLLTLKGTSTTTKVAQVAKAALWAVPASASAYISYTIGSTFARTYLNNL